MDMSRAGGAALTTGSNELFLVYARVLGSGALRNQM